MKLITNPKDPRWIFSVGEPSEMAALTKHLNKIPQYQLLPSYKGTPTPEVFLNQFTTPDGRKVYYCSVGLWKEIYDFAVAKKLQINKIPENLKLSTFNLSKTEFREYIYKWNLNIVPREYQIDAAWLILKYRRSLSELATRAGKTLIAYMVFRTAMELMGVKKILMIVPSIQLVKQGVEDMSEYKEFFSSEQIWAQGEHVDSANLTIGTFQSLVLKADKRSRKYDPDFFKDYDLICVDECHKLPCKSIQTILNLDFMKNVKLQFGFSGTIPKPRTIEWFCCQAMMGPKIQEISAHELIEAGYLAKPLIKQFRLKYISPETDENYLDTAIRCAEYLVGNYKLQDGKKILLPKDQRDFTIQHVKELPAAVSEIKKLYDKHEYYIYLSELVREASQTLVLEQMLVQRSQPHYQLIEQLINGFNKNVIVFAHNTEYINFLVEKLKTAFPNKNVYKIIGGTNLKKRQEVLDKMLESNDNILVGSFGAVGTGLTFKNVDYAIFAQSFKSEIITSQSLGRCMLRTRDKAEFYLYDIIDQFPDKKIYNQGLAKIRTYKEEKHQYTIEKREPQYLTF